MEDLELLEELRLKAAEAGEKLPLFCCTMVSAVGEGRVGATASCDGRR